MLQKKSGKYLLHNWRKKNILEFKSEGRRSATERKDHETVKFLLFTIIFTILDILEALPKMWEKSSPFIAQNSVYLTYFAVVDRIKYPGNVEKTADNIDE